MEKLTKDEIMTTFNNFYIYHKFGSGVGYIEYCCPFSDYSYHNVSPLYGLTKYSRTPDMEICNQTCWKYFNINCLRCPCHIFTSNTAMNMLYDLLKVEGYIDES